MYLDSITKEMVLAVTHGKKVERKPLSEKAIALNRIIDSGFGCERENVRKLISSIINESLTVQKTSLLPMTAVVLLTNTNSHDYPLNEVLLTYGLNTKALIKKSGLAGNDAPLHDTKAFRLATVEEIEAAFATEASVTIKPEVVKA